MKFAMNFLGLVVSSSKSKTNHTKFVSFNFFSFFICLKIGKVVKYNFEFLFDHLSSEVSIYNIIQAICVFVLA